MLTAILERVVQGPLDHEAHERHIRIEPTCETNRPDTFPTQAVVVTTAARRIIDLSKNGDKVKSLVITGDRDPMEHGDFREIAENIKELQKKWFPKATMVLETRGFHMDTADLRHTLSLFDRPLVRFEYGTQKSFTALTGRKGTDLKDIVENLDKIELERWVLTATFVRGAADNSTPSEVKNWLKYVEDLKPGGVRIGTLAKEDKERKLKPVTKTRMDEIEAQIAEKTGLQVELAKPI
ncbi:hypothetical protein [Engelhardtia mirabilis]|uniref:Radical SAM superfamily protein n=1 Tax=Engelhardtia mirabilis TaxID=2528011 RepID=A0A518BSB5_9BACT|nr:hypothetical protein Pla133_49840 [Planctomycetes bacterium Pla133]QDV04187.1 hypothetical protein Pla86_49820 [Planctomycetes bacterium Pla86]